MRHRRRHRDDGSLPSGLAEVELFRFWEADLAEDLPTDLVALPPSPRPTTAPVWMPSDIWMPMPTAGPSTAPLWCAACLVLLVLLSVLVAVLV